MKIFPEREILQCNSKLVSVMETLFLHDLGIPVLEFLIHFPAALIATVNSKRVSI